MRVDIYVSNIAHDISRARKRICIRYYIKDEATQIQNARKTSTVDTTILLFEVQRPGGQKRQKTESASLHISSKNTCISTIFFRYELPAHR